MNWKERQDWLKEMYPLTVVMDRYNGTYSDAKFLAFPLDFDVVPMEVNGSDTECAYFWKNYEEPVGKGASAQEAIDDLVAKMKDEDESERIRKFLIDLLSCGIWKEEWPFSPPECVEYLEKQKDSIPYEKYVEDIAAINAEAKTKYHAGWNDGYEAKQKEPLPIPDKFSGLKSLMLQYLQSAANRKDDTEIENDTDLFGRKILDYVWKYSNEQKEQKPADVAPNQFDGIIYGMQGC